MDFSDFESGMVIGPSFSETDDLLRAELTALKWPPPDLNPTDHLWEVAEQKLLIVDVQLTNLEQLCDAIMLMDQNECFLHLCNSVPQRIKSILKSNLV